MLVNGIKMPLEEVFSQKTIRCELPSDISACGAAMTFLRFVIVSCVQRYDAKRAILCGAAAYAYLVQKETGTSTRSTLRLPSWLLDKRVVESVVEDGGKLMRPIVALALATDRKTMTSAQWRAKIDPTSPRPRPQSSFHQYSLLLLILDS